MPPQSNKDPAHFMITISLINHSRASSICLHPWRYNVTSLCLPNPLSISWSRRTYSTIFVHDIVQHPAVPCIYPAFWDISELSHYSAIFRGSLILSLLCLPFIFLVTPNMNLFIALWKTRFSDTIFSSYLVLLGNTRSWTGHTRDWVVGLLFFRNEGDSTKHHQTKYNYSRYFQILSLVSTPILPVSSSLSP